ncbi:MAG: helix-turn-helix domain-containing protein [Phycisphaera sp.]|nr:helix-turn-helix domain-containing protein [Phycisphaera sp.]
MSIPYRRFLVALAVGYPAGFEDEIVHGAIDYSDQFGHWQLASAGHRPFLPFDEIDLTEIDGVIGLLWPEMAEAIARAGVAAVNTSTRIAELPLPRVGNDDEAIGRMGAEYLLGKGYPHFGFVSDPNAWYSHRRREGFQRLIQERAGQTCRVLELASNSEEQSESMIKRWLDENPRPIALMAVNDSYGRRLINTVVKVGLRVPEDVAVLGVDNDRWASTTSAVPMSSVALDARQIGYKAAQMLDHLMKGDPAPPPVWVPPIGVVTRRSTDIVMSADPLVIEALRVIRERCGQTLTVDGLLDVLGVSRRSLETRMKKAIGQTPQSAIFRAQVEKSKPMLLNTPATMAQISEACGFHRQERFSLVFKRLTGLTPGRFRQERGLRREG